MALSNLLKELRQSRQVVAAPKLRTIPKTERSYNALLSKFLVERTPNFADAISIKQRVLLDEGRSSIDSLSLRELRLAAAVLFEPPDRLIDRRVPLSHLLRRFRSVRSRLIYKRLIFLYCAHFDPTSQPLIEIGDFLAKAVLDPSNKLDAWRERHLSFNLFDPRVVVQTIGDHALSCGSPIDALNQAGLTGQLARSRLSVLVYGTLLDAAQVGLKASPSVSRVDKIISWSLHNEELIFSSLRGKLSETLLLPWLDRAPSVEIRNAIQQFLLAKIGDPRTDLGAWIGVDPAARDVLARWLAQATLEQFLRVVDRVAAQHQWEYRRAFWSAYLAKGWVSEAWVAFGSTGAAAALRIAREANDEHMRRFAQLNGGSPDQAVLVLRIGDLCVADWSHNGKLRIWLQENLSAPKLWQSSYAATELRSGSDFDTAHLPPDGWQSKAETYIRRYTGLRLSASDYMPKRGR